MGGRPPVAVALARQSQSPRTVQEARPDAARSSDGVLVWTKLRLSNGALEGMNNKVKVISHRAYGYRTTWTYIANIYHCCAEPASQPGRR